MKIGILGHFGGEDNFNDGQTVKTITVYNALKRYGLKDIHKIDTYYARKNPLKFGIAFLNSICQDSKYIVLLSNNGRKILFPILYILSRFFHKEIYHYAIGGMLAEETKEHPVYLKYISSFKANWLESVSLSNQLQEIGIKNAYYLPNFKKLTILSEKDLTMDYSEPYKFCTFSRVMKEKGVEDAIEAIESINRHFKRIIVTLDIYGPIENHYKEYLKQLLNNTTACTYCGVIPHDKSVEILKNYYVLLFPTRWKAEGIPGTIIDALSAGLPVIARKWPYCDEMLQHKVTGYIYDFEAPEKLEETIMYAITHVSETLQMKPECLKNALKYSEPYVIQQITDSMGL